MGRLGTFLLGIYLTAFLVASLYALVGFWPETQGEEDADAAAAASVQVFGTFEVVPEIQLILLVAAAGALGSSVANAMSFVHYVGQRRLSRNWTWWYLLRPFAGMALAVILYAAMRGGLMTMGTSVSDINPYGIAAVGGLVGMFIVETTDKLEAVAKTLLGKKERGDST